MKLMDCCLKMSGLEAINFWIFETRLVKIFWMYQNYCILIGFKKLQNYWFELNFNQNPITITEHSALQKPLKFRSVFPGKHWFIYIFFEDLLPSTKFQKMKSGGIYFCLFQQYSKLFYWYMYIVLRLWWQTTFIWNDIIFHLKS